MEETSGKNSVFLGKTTKSVFFVPKVKLINDIKDEILGKNYCVSIVFIGEKKSKYLNNKYRKINKPTDVLSFNIDKNNGEVFITPKVAIKKSGHFGMNSKKYLLFLVIHAFLHLKGYKHGVKMEKAEESFLDVYSKNFN